MINSETKNDSFIQMQRWLRKKGIRNFEFMLTLNNPELQDDVDPWDPNITQMRQAAILQECSKNFWYFVREVIRIKEDVGVILNPSTMATWWNILDGISTWKTSTQSDNYKFTYPIFLLYNLLFKNNSSYIIMSLLLNQSKETISMVHEILMTCLPHWMGKFLLEVNIIGCSSSYNDIRNQKGRSMINVMPWSVSENQAHLQFRGNTSEIVLFNICERDFRKRDLSLLQIMLDYRAPILRMDEKKRFNSFNFIIEADGPYYYDYLEYTENMLKWQDRFYDYDRDGYRNMLSKYGNGVVHVKY